MPVVGAKITSTMPPMITQDRKWGRYSTVWKIFLTLTIRISLSMMARTMGTGKPKSRSKKFRISVLPSAMGKSRMEKTNSKLSQPTHLLPATPLKKLYFWNAITRPYMGL